MIEVFTDGASSGSPGISGAGIYIKANKQIKEYSMPLPVMTNHEAEFHAVIQALDICINLYPGEIISLQSDSQLVVQGIEKRFVKNEQYQALLNKVLQRIANFPYVFAKWIPNKQNFHADRLAKKAIQQQK